MQSVLIDETIEVKYDKLFQSNKELLDSIHYAGYVQQGIFPHERHFKRLFNDYFIFYRPQGIVGGDLYWIGEKAGIKYFAVGDCTGHGISGSLLSVMALSFLNYIVLGKTFKKLGEVLQELDKKWIETFHQGTELGYNNDWLEIGICSFNEKTRELQFAGAFNKLTIVCNSELKELMGNKFPIGGWQLETCRKYDTQSVVLDENTSVYLYSDGFKDQFGYETKKRYSSKRLKELIYNLHQLPMNEQRAAIEDNFNTWKGIEEQTDDVCLFGVKL